MQILANRHIDKRIFLDLIGLRNRDITDARLTRFLDRLNPDDILKHIRIPHFVVSKSDNGNNPNARPTSKSGPNPHQPLEPPNNCKIVFKHLKTVKAILHISIDDLSGKRAPHTNKAIISCLEHFRDNIEQWDWKKIDICSDTILEAAPKARDIYLYSSGNNAVLKSWSAPDGLLRFTCVGPIPLGTNRKVN